MVVIQLLLPSPNSSAGASAAQSVADTRRELVERFGGVTAFLRSPARGAWISPDGRVELDDMVMVEVVAPVFDRDWWRNYADVLKRRFAQDEILVRGIEISVLE